MQSEPQCIPCVLKQCERVVEVVWANDSFRQQLQANYAEKEQLLSQIRHQALEITSRLSLQDPPSKFTSQVLKEIYQVLNLNDPFEFIKKAQNDLGRNIYPVALKEIKNSPDPLHLAISFSACGNIIDVGPADIYSVHNQNISLIEEICSLAQQRFAIDDYKIFKEKFRTAENILYILDNAGEIYLDKLLLERLKGPELIIAVKTAPILNDALKNDAVVAGLDGIGKIITVTEDKNCRFLGVDFSCTSEVFNAIFDSADMVIAKGHANFESLVDCERDCFFILMAKCPVVAQKLGVKIKDRVLYYSPIKSD
ncbi:MAG: ARMT1-like domain-containing protein [candidate division WOR-3 bacterium]|nr:ARMT1-like domain-containing protein [candidate division WOR-3 bacterium]